MEENKYCYKYPHPAVTTDCVIFGFDGTKLQVLLIERGIEPFKGKWAFPGGFLNMDESAEQGALRELREETGLTGAFIEQFGCFSEPDRDPRERVITIAYYALVKIQHVVGGDDAAKARWFALDDVPQLAFDHDRILRELQSLYEAILDIKFDRRNFAKKMLHFDLVTQLDETTWPTARRAANLFRFNKQNYDELKRKGFQLEF